MQNKTGRESDSTRTQENVMKDQEKQDIVAKEVDGNAIDALSAELADSIAAQSEQPQELQNAFDEKEKELEDEGLVSKGEDAAVVAAADGDLAAMIAADTNAQGGDAAASGGSESGVSAGMMVAAGAVAVGGIVAASGGDGGSGGGKNNQEFTVSIDSPSATEGDSGTKVLNFTVTLDEAPKKESTFNYSVTGGTATGDVDFDRDSGTVTFAPGQTEATISVVVRGDTTFEADETVLLTVSGAKVEGQNNSVTATGTIVNDDPDPATLQYDLSVNSPTVVEGDDGTVVLRYELTLDRVPTEAVQVGFETLTSGTATADVDFVAAAGSVTFTAGQDSAIVDIVINGDEILEPNETVDVRFTGPQLSAPVTGTGTIIENDLDPSVDAKSATTSPDDLTANIINANPEFTPGGNTLINTFQDEDSYTGVGVDPTLNVVLGNPNDLQEVIVTPKADGFKIANFEFTAGTPAFGTNVTGGVDFQDFTGLEELNVNRVLTTNGAIVLQNIARETDDVSVMDATRGGVLNFNYQEEVLTGTNEVLDFAVEDTRLAALNLVEGTDGGSDAGFFFEEINMSSNNITDLDLFVIQANGREDLVAGNAADTTKQTFNLTAGDAPGASGYTEFNRLLITGVDTWNLEANHIVDVAIDPEVPLTSGLFVPAVAVPPTPAVLGNDGVNSVDLEALNITGGSDVLIDGLEGNVGVFADAAGLTVDGSAMTGDLTIGISGGTGDEAGVANTALDDLFSLTSGSGDDTVATYGILGGDIATGAGADTVLVTVGTVATPANTDGLASLLGTASIETGAGADIVSAANLGVLFFAGGLGGGTTDQNAVNNSGFDDILDAYISTGADNDTVTVGTLMSGQDWDNFQLNDANIDDLFFVSGSWVDLGSGDNTITLTSMMEGTKVMAEDGSDTVNVELGAATVLAGDTNADRQTLGNTASTQPGAGGTKEVDLNGNVDRLGAVIELGGGDDVANFIDSMSIGVQGQTIVGRDAEFRAGAGNDVMNVTALDATLVSTTTSAADQDILTSGVQTDANANILGVETLNATIENQIDATTAAATGETQNDEGNVVPVPPVASGELDGMIQVDVMRFDSAFTDLNLVSNEQRLLQNPTTEVYEQGEQTTFNVFNLRQPSVSLSLMAHEASGISGAGGPSNGATPATGNLQDDRIIDVTLNADLDDARAEDDAFELDILAGSESFDLDLQLGATTTDLVGNAASSTDDDDLLAEHATINLLDNQSHRILFNGFGDMGQSNTYVEGSLTVETSVTVNDSKDNSTIVIDQVTADTITSTGAADTEVYVGGFAAPGVVPNAGAVAMTPNNYEITTGSGDDLIDLFFDNIRPDDNVDDAADADNVDATDEADKVDAGSGTDRLRASGDDNLGSTLLGTDDDVFESLLSLEELEIGTEIVTGAGKSGVEFFAGGVTNNVVLDEAAQDKTNLQDIIFSGGDWVTNAIGTVIPGNGAQTTNLTIGENFENDLMVTSIEEGNEKEARLVLNIDNQDSDTDVDLVNMDFFVSTQFGTTLNFINTGDPDAEIDITARVSDLNGGTTFIDNFGIANGVLDLRVVAGDLDTLTLLDNKSDADGLADDNDMIDVTVSDAWSTTQAGAAENDEFNVDASQVEDDDGISTTGGMIFRGQAETDSDLIVSGTQNDDTFIGGLQNDTFDGNDGDDTASGGQGDDILRGGDGDDNLLGQAGKDTLNGQDGDDRLTGGAESDSLTGGDGEDAFIYNATAESDGRNNSTDTITDFEEGVDSIEYTLNAIGANNSTGGGDIFNLGRFAQVANAGAGDNSLDGTPAATATTIGQVAGDAYWADTNEFAIDVDGNGDITEGDDLQITSNNAIGAGDLDLDVNAGGNGDLIRGGQGSNELFGNAGDDILVALGSLDAADVANYNAAGNNAAVGIDGTIEDVIDFTELTSTRGESEVNMGDTYDGGAGNDTLHLFGSANLAAAGATVNSIETTVVHSDVTMTLTQLYAMGQIVFSGNTDHTLTIVADDGSTLTYAQQLAAIASMPNPIGVVGSGANTTITIGGQEIVDAPANDATAANAVNFEIGNVGGGAQPNAPTAPDLDASDDSGISNSDNITNVTTDLDFSGTNGQILQPGETVTVFDDIDNDGVFDAGETSFVVDSLAPFANYAGQLDLAEGTHYIRAFVTDDNGIRSDMSAPVTLTVIDVSAPAQPTVMLNADTGSSNADGITNDNVINVGALEVGSTWEYSLDGGTSWVAGVGSSFNMVDNTTYAAGQIQVRQTDAAGNISNVGSNGVSWVEDSTAPAVPTIALNSDSGASNIDGITNDNAINVSGLEGTATWEYSLDGGATWNAGVGSSFNMVDDTNYAAGQIQVRQTDVAGNTSAAGNNGAAWTEDSTDPAAPALSLNTDSGVSAADGITNDNQVNVAGLEGGATWEYSLDGGTNWNVGVGSSFNMADDTSYAAGQILVRQTDVAGNTSATGSNGMAWTEDSTIATPTIALQNDTGVSNSDGTTSDNEIDVSGLEAGATWEYSLDSGATWTAGTGTSFSMADNTAYGAGAIQVRQTDVAGNLSPAGSNGIAWTEDSLAPATPTIALNADNGNSDPATTSDGVTNDNVINVGNLEGGATWEFSLDAGATWTAGTGSTFNLADNTTYNVGDIQVRQSDVAGNQSATGSNAAAITEDSNAPAAPTIALNADTGALANDGVTSDNVVNVAGLEAGATWQYSLDGGTTWVDGIGTSFNLADDATYAAGMVQVQQTDTAGNTSASGDNAIDWTEDSSNPAAPTLSLNSDTGSSNADGITNDNVVNVGGLEAGASWEYSLDAGATWTAGTGSTFSMGDDTAYAAGDLQARQTDVAGNTGVAGSNGAAWTEDSTAPVAPATFLSADAGTDTFIIDFAEDLGSADASLIDLYVNGALVGVNAATVDGNGDLAVESAFDFAAADTLDVAFDVGAVTDIAGNMLQAVALGDNPAPFVVV